MEQSQNLSFGGFFIHFDGDASVGIFPSTWTLTGTFNFDSPEDLIGFTNKILEAFEHCSDTPIWIESVEDYGKRYEADEKVFLENSNLEKL